MRATVGKQGLTLADAERLGWGLDLGDPEVLERTMILGRVLAVFDRIDPEVLQKKSSSGCQEDRRHEHQRESSRSRGRVQV